ncbi:unnamed protein product [Brugia pahangi]|uniref:Nuclear pore complex protein Nup85 n=1 Tax=Brugia pahangi TaxID=6280 RepID=A0A0N4T091_BRUPA|nr:unnamed protein product [Brugia pahangi]
MEKGQPEEGYDHFERAIRKTGCWEEHLTCAECMSHTKDWRECKEEEAMLSELFAEFIIDSDDCDVNDRSHMNHIDPYVYVPLDRSPRWFLDDNLFFKNNNDNRTRETVQNQAAFAYLQGDYISSMNLYFYLLENEPKNGNSNSVFALIDSIIRCGLKIAPINGPQLLFLLQKLHALVSTYEDQLQYWTESLDVYLATGTSTSDYLRNAILLCASVDLPEFWISISKNSPVSCVNLRIGSLCRAIYILENSPPSKAKCLNSYDLQQMKAELQNLCNKEKLSEAKAAVCSDLIRSENTNATEVNRPSLSKSFLKDKKAEDVMILEFIHRFYWLFADMDQQLVNSILQVS